MQCRDQESGAIRLGTPGLQRGASPNSRYNFSVYLALQSAALPQGLTIARFVKTVRALKNGVFWDVTPCGSSKNRRFGGTCLVFLRSVRRLLVTASVVPSSPIVVNLMREALSSSKTSVLSRITRRNIPEKPFFIVTAAKTSNLT
jgi:hypothetical protein